MIFMIVAAAGLGVNTIGTIVFCGMPFWMISLMHTQLQDMVILTHTGILMDTHMATVTRKRIQRKKLMSMPVDTNRGTLTS